MRVVVIGPGAVGGLIAGHLRLAGHDVSVVARGEHLVALNGRGLVLAGPDDMTTVPLPAVAHPAELAWDGTEVVFLTVKSQDTEGALEALAAAAPVHTPVVCAQNGVANERRALRRFARTYGLVVMCPATHLEPGVVQAHSAPITGLLDLGCFPEGVDEVAAEVAGALNGATFDSRAVPDVMRWKRRKLLLNLMNAAEALCGPEGRGGRLAELVIGEGERVLARAGLAVASADEDATRREGRLTLRPTGRGPWGGGSSWQSLARGTGRIEADFLNGEIALLARLHGTAAPANALLQHLAGRAAAEGRPAGSLSVEELTGRLEAAVSDGGGDDPG